MEIRRTIRELYRVEQLVSEHLSAQGRLNPRVRLCCFWCLNKLEFLLLAHLTHYYFFKNGLETRKLRPPNRGG
jgi:hypothetical protein